MMSPVSYQKTAFQLTLVYLVSISVVTFLAFIAPLFLSLPKGLPKSFYSVIYLGLILSASYWSVGLFLRKKSKKLNLFLVSEDGVERVFSGVPFALLMFGFYWRVLFVGVVVSILGALATGLMFKLAGDNLSKHNIEGFKYILAILNCYFAFYWLLVSQYGSFQIVKAEDVKLLQSKVIDADVVFSDVKSGLKDTVNGILGTTFVISYFSLGVLQFFACYDFFRIHWDWNWFGSGLTAISISYIPILGSLAGIVGATKVWGWDLWVALLLFCYPFVIGLIILILSGSFSIASGFFGNKR